MTWDWHNLPGEPLVIIMLLIALVVSVGYSFIQDEALRKAWLLQTRLEREIRDLRVELAKRRAPNQEEERGPIRSPVRTAASSD